MATNGSGDGAVDSTPSDGFLEVSSLLDPRSSLGLESRCASLGILAGKHPVRVLNSMLKYLDDKPASGIKIKHALDTWFD